MYFALGTNGMESDPSPHPMSRIRSAVTPSRRVATVSVRMRIFAANAWIYHVGEANDDAILLSLSCGFAGLNDDDKGLIQNWGLVNGEKIQAGK
jgi:hypothetical protein